MSLLRSSLKLGLSKRLLVRSTNLNKLPLFQYRSYATEKKTDEYKSILNDDLLSKAGLNEDDIKSDKQSSSEKAYEDEFGQPKKRRNNTKSSIDKKKERYAKLFWFSILGGSIAGCAYLCRDWDPILEKEFYNQDENGFDSPTKIFKRLNKRLNGVTDVFNEPAYNDLLPDPMPEPYRHPLTLVLELDDLLVHSTWDYKTGWKTAKRPGVDYFLGYLSQYYEIVIFSKSSMAFAENTVSKLDPYHAFITYSLFREACRSQDGKIIKDLSLMNRDLGKLIIIDPDQSCYSMQPENAIPIEKWDGSKDDQLIRLIPFLEYLATQPIKDVRPILSSFKSSSNDISTEFQIRESKLREQWELKQQQLNNSNVFTNLLGIPPTRRKMPLDSIREVGQQNYLNMYNYLKENGEKLLKEEQEKTKEMLADQKLTLEKLVTEGMPTAEDIAKQQAAAALQDKQ
ncbi:hypothetical protein CANARDRAFT_100646 [[Candida] arabinofermentans NRRL YB-2248]|uniref:Mitochondrial import inner membrane translocase subunit TIM50 n=1 Tax=[Candida] arabinofermentans NRRL YB-2248 TaxID=983967 RepID=A0A1E4SUM6_9ASCO|nr:hypothetical protein CANARDRAFT_100646 [[Candida] arabinofermentans NRRL YB-2248]